jgi:hypothetical protein
MKKFILPLLYLGLFFSTSTQNTTAQFREVQSLRNFDGSPLDLYGYNPYYNPIAESPRDFNFNLNFYDIYTLMNLEAAKRNANQTAINNWMRKQENVFKDEINRQLGTNHSNFNDAQRAYFKNFELQNRTLNTRISNLGSNYYTIANTINKTQETNTMQLFALDNFRNAALPDLKNIEINGKKISDMANSGNANYELSMARLTVQNQFAAKEYASAQNSALGVGIYLLHDDQTMINDFVNQHINFYKSKVDLRDKVSLMTLYLTDHLKGNLGPLAYNPYAITIPYFSQHDKLLAMGKAKTPNLNVEALVFAPNYIEDYNCYQRKPNPRGFNDTFTNAQCNARKIELYAIKDRVIEEHKNALYVPGINLGNKLYGSQWTSHQYAGWLRDYLNNSQILQITEFLNRHNNSLESIKVGKEFLAILATGTPLGKSFVQALLNNNENSAIDILLKDATYSYPNCPVPPCLDELEALPAQIVLNAIIGAENLLAAYFEWTTEDEFQGKLMRKAMPKMGIEIPWDVSNTTLGELFTFRISDNKNLVIEYEKSIKEELLLVGLSTLDILALASPGTNAGAFFLVKTGTTKISAATLSSYLKNNKIIIANLANTTLKGGRGFNTFDAFKKAIGQVKPGHVYHHIVEQNGFKSLNKFKFGSKSLHNTKNIIEIPDGAQQLHKRVTGYYQSKPDFTDGKTVREWLSGKDFEFQYQFGIKVLKDFGWDGVYGLIP